MKDRAAAAACERRRRRSAKWGNLVVFRMVHVVEDSFASLHEMDKVADI